MSPSSVEPGDLLDLKLMPAWVKEPAAAQDYSQFEGETVQEPHDRGPDRRSRRTGPPERGRSVPQRPGNRQRKGRQPRPDGRRLPDPRRYHEREPQRQDQPIEVAVQFLPRAIVLDNVVSQVKAGSVAYSLYFLARSFLDKPQRYEVLLKAKPGSPLYRLGETTAISVDRAFLESNAFRLVREHFYKVEVTENEPLKGNFTSVARCRLSGTVLGPTNHHDYQRRLRNLYEQRFGRRMSFADYQRQIEIVSDPAAVEQWKEEARKVTTFATTREETPLTFQTATETERHFRQNYLPELVQTADEVTIDGITSRELCDLRLRRHIEQAWVHENRSPSHMMQELAKAFREAGLHIFRHRRGMLFVSSIRVRPFTHDEESVSAHVTSILQTVAASPRIRRKELADTLLGDAGEDLDARKLALASDLHWLINEGHLIEFNDGTLDLPRTRPSKATPEAAEKPEASEASAEIAASPETAPTPQTAPSETPVNELKVPN